MISSVDKKEIDESRIMKNGNGNYEGDRRNVRGVKSEGNLEN